MSKLTINEFNNIIDNNPDIDIFTFISDRDGWKTSSVQIALIKNAIENNEPFALIRTKKDEYISDSWFSEYTKSFFSEYGAKFITTRINANIIKISAIINEEEKIVFYGLWLSLAEKYKSNYFEGFEKIKFLVWEECIPNKRISQNIKNVIEYHSDMLFNILSIGSTIGRKNRIQYIFLGNDIPFNIINPITVNFDILEQLSENCVIIDECQINNRKYNFYFNYFSFDGAVNHWLINTENDINNSIAVEKRNTLNFVLKSQYKSYYIYYISDYIYITDKNNDNKTDVINNTYEFFKFYDELEMLKKYDNLSMALTILYTFREHLRKPIIEYFGNPNNPVFKKSNKTNPHNLINLYELSKMKYSDILQLSNIADIRNLINILKNSNVIYSNVAIKLLCESLKSKFIFV